jgi:hypothetical protein
MHVLIIHLKLHALTCTLAYIHTSACNYTLYIHLHAIACTACGTYMHVYICLYLFTSEDVVDILMDRMAGMDGMIQNDKNTSNLCC